MAASRSIRDLDWPLLLITLAICGLGVLQIYSATDETIWRDAWWKQIVFIAVGLVLLWIVTNIDYHTLLGQVYLFYAISVVTLVAVFLVGSKVFGSRRWIPVGGGFKFQVSEFAKLVIVLLVAKVMTELKRDDLDWRNLLKIIGLVGLPMVLVMKQPDLGTALTYLPILGIGILIAGLRWQYVGVIALVLALVLPVGWFFLQDYQRPRLTTFLDPAKDPKGQGYQSIQSKLAVSHGGMWG